MGLRNVAAITLGRTVWISDLAYASEELLLHEFCHVQQFDTVPAFPVRYLWESLRPGLGGLLAHLKLWETNNNTFEYAGE